MVVATRARIRCTTTLLIDNSAAELIVATSLAGVFAWHTLLPLGPAKAPFTESFG